MQVTRLLRRLDHSVLGTPRRVVPPEQVKPKWLRSSKDVMALLRIEVEGLRGRVAALEEAPAPGTTPDATPGPAAGAALSSPADITPDIARDIAPDAAPDAAPTTGAATADSVRAR